MTGYEHPPLPYGAQIDDDGVWCQILNRSANRTERPTLFLDRDGVLVEEVHYLSRPQDVQLIPFAADVVAKANSKSIPVIIVTNQAGIGYGKYGWQDFIDVQEQILNDLEAQGAFINAVYACPFHAQGKPPYQHPDHHGRKPNPGMFEKAERHFAIDKSLSWIIGDRVSDLQAGKHFQITGGIHVSTGHGGTVEEQLAAGNLATEAFRVHSASGIGDALDLLDILK